MARAHGTQSEANWLESARCRRLLELLLSPARSDSTGFFVIKPDGRISIQSGIGNLGTESVIDVHRVVREILGVPWEKCDITWGNTAKDLPWTCVSGGSQTTHAMTRAAHAAAMDAKQKLQEIAAKTLGGKPESYEVANERVFRKGGGGSMTLAQAAQHAIELGGIYDGHEVPEDMNKYTKASVAALAGQGLVAAAKDNYPHDGQTFSYVASFAEVEVDVETGKYHIVDFLAMPTSARSSIPAPRRTGSGPLDAGHRPCHRTEVGLRSSVWPHDFAGGSIKASRRRFWMCQSTCSGRRWIFLIRKRRSARAASASRRWAAVAPRS